MKPHQLRVIIEKAELDLKIGSLDDFIENSPIYQALPNEEKGRLHRQLAVMFDYTVILGERIAAFGVTA